MCQRTSSVNHTGWSAQEDDIHVLHVDDDASFGDLAKAFLERESDQFEVRTETRAQDGLERLADDDTQTDCIVSDYDMPLMNGIEFLRAVRSEYPDLPFILFTGKGCEAVARDALRVGATDYIQKQRATDNYGVLANRIQNAVEKHRAERSQRQLLDLAEHANQVSFVFNSDWTELLFVNDAYEDIWGQSTEALAENPRNFLEGVHPDHRERVRTEMQRLSAGESIETEYRVNADESYGRWVRVRGVPILDNTDEVVRVAGFASEITDEREREQHLEQARTVFKHSRVALFLVDVTEDRFEIRRVNQAYEELTGFSARDVTDNTPREIVGEEAGDQIVSRYRTCVEQRAPLDYDGGLSMTGDERSRQTKLAPVVEDGEVTRLVGATR